MGVCIKQLFGYQNNIFLIQYIFLAKKSWGGANPKDDSSIFIYTMQSTLDYV